MQRNKLVMQQRRFFKPQELPISLRVQNADCLELAGGRRNVPFFFCFRPASPNIELA